MVKSKSKRGTTRRQSSSNYTRGSQKSRSKLPQSSVTVHSAFSYLWCVDCIKPKTTDPNFDILMEEDVQSQVSPKEINTDGVCTIQEWRDQGRKPSEETGIMDASMVSKKPSQSPTLCIGDQW